MGVKAYVELEEEVLLRHGAYMSPVVVHGVRLDETLPEFLGGKDLSGLVLGVELANKVQADMASKVFLITPAQTNSLLTDIPRQVSDRVSDFNHTSLSQEDFFHIWTRASLLQNLMKKRNYNKVVLASAWDKTRLESEIINPRKDEIRLSTWEEKNASLVWALNLEAKVMLFLFIAMCFLVAICILSGFMIFFGKIKIDLASFWILGFSHAKIAKLSLLFIHALSAIASVSGLLVGLILLAMLDKFGTNIMPSVFVERNIPILLNAKNILFSLLLPYGVSFLFSFFALKLFKNEESDYIQLLRTVG